MLHQSFLVEYSRAGEATCSEDDRVAALLLLLGDLLEVLVDDGHSQEDTRARANGAHEVGEDAEGADADSTEGSCGVDVTGELLDHRLLSPALNHQVLVHQLLHDVLGRLA